MREDLTRILRSASRRLVWTRAAEATAVGAIGGGLCAAVLQAACLLAPLSRTGAMLLCLTALIAALAILRWMSCHGRLSPAMTILLVVLWWLGIVVGEAYLVGGAIPPTAAGRVALLLLPAGALVAGLPVLIRGVPLRAAALVLDVRVGLGERLSTAAELVESAAADTSAAKCVYRQALEAAERARALRVPLWRRTRTTAGALGLAILLCGVLAIVPAPEPVRAGPALAATGDGPSALPDDGGQALRAIPPEAVRRAAVHRVLSEVPAAERSRMVEALRRQAEEADDAEKARALLAAAEAIEAGDAEALEASLDELARLGAEPPSAVGEALASATADGPVPRRVGVWNPEYARELAPKGATPRAGNGERRVERFVQPEDAWAAARRRAAESLRDAAAVPPEYRRLVRAFFLSD